MTFTAGFILSVIIVLIALLPIAFLITVMCSPLWLWIENTLHIEAMGHSGPAEWCFLLVYGLCVGITGCFYKKIKILATISILMLIILMLLPLPHGGSIGETLIHELPDIFDEIRQQQQATKHENFQRQSASQTLKERLADRFTGTLDFNRDFTQDHWQTGSVLGKKAWHDSNTGMIWGPRQDSVLQGWSQADLQSAIAFCSNVAPQGYWSLPTNAEFALGVKSNMQNYINDLAGMWIAQSYSLGVINPMPSVVGFGNQGTNNTQRGSSGKLIRCIGRSDSAPLHGYIRDDISNEDVLRLLTR